MKPHVIVALGGTALRALTGTAASIDSARREQVRHATGARIIASYHPLAIVRAEGKRATELRTILVSDLRLASELAASAR